jgi:polar amino acid transport system substrate-binding protein
MYEEARSQLAPHGVLRAGINLSNILLVTGRSEAGDPTGVAPDMARAIAERLNVPLSYVPFPKPGALADAAGKDAWDIGLIGDEPARAEKIAFTPPYVEIVATYLVPSDSTLKTAAEVDRPGIRIAVEARTAFELWLSRNIVHAQLFRSDSLEAVCEQFVREKLEALADLKPRLLSTVETIPGTRILEGQFTAVQQAVGTARVNLAGAAFLREFVEEAKASGFVESLIKRHNVQGLSVALPGPNASP